MKHYLYTMEIWPSSASLIPDKNYFFLKSILTCYHQRHSSSSTCMYIAPKMQELIFFFLKFPCYSCQDSRQSTQLKLFFFQLELPSLFLWCFSSLTLCSFSLHCVLLVSRLGTLESFYWVKFRIEFCYPCGNFFSQGNSKSNWETLVWLCWDNETIIKLLIRVQLIKRNPNLTGRGMPKIDITLLVFMFIYNNIGYCASVAKELNWGFSWTTSATSITGLVIGQNRTWTMLFIFH